MPRISVILCTYNRAPYLQRTLKALTRQSMPPGEFETVVVDDGSTDETPAVCERMAVELNGLRYFRIEPNSGLSMAASKAFQEAAGEQLIITDDDCIPRADWVARMSAALDREMIVAGAVDTPRHPYLKLCHNVAQFQEFLPGGSEREVNFAAGANMGMRRTVVAKVGDLDTRRGVAKDTDLILRARAHGHRVLFVPDAVVLHDPPLERNNLGKLMAYAATHSTATIILRQQHARLLWHPFVLRSPFLILTLAPVIALHATIDIYSRNPTARRVWRTAPVVYLLKIAWCWGAVRGLRNMKRAEKAG